ncbi:response regulator [Polyangium spumosum]|uniref:Response regulator n=2 Tax=Polyangium spumosum TaxID=889282 RepID=A0A6N7PPQ2_9BACT|nr:response regulator [Polyangium spumosum]
MLADFLGMEGYIVRTAEDGNAALGELTKSHYDLIISDLKMPKMGGIQLLDEIGKTSPDALTVIMTGFGTVETAIDAMKRGAYDYVLKPFKLDEVVHVVQRGLEKQRMAAENLRLREALGLYKVSEAIQASLSLDQVLETVAESCLSEVRSDLVSTWLDDGEGGLFERQHIRGPQLPEDAAIGALDHDKIAVHLRAEATLLEQGPRGLKFFSAPPEVPLYSLVAVPLRIGQRFMGFIALASFSKGRRFEEGQRKLLSIIASRAAAAIENARLYQDLQATFQQTIQGLAKAIDKMDRYTSGHSDRVALYAVFLARQLGLSAFEIEIVRQSALMHDIGKIGCVLNLNKPGKLTQDEYEVFKKHPVYGRDILDPIKFLHPLIPGVHLHHERWDGRGYPLKMKGNEIPIIARIIAVADTYDAMTSDRSYRRALPHEVAVAEIERCSGSQFDPEVAANFTDKIEGYRDERRSAGDKVPE